jgi:hypothetical protein
MTKKIRVKSYTKTDGTRVKSYMREDPRAQESVDSELPSDENPDMSFTGESYKDNEDDKGDEL